MSAGSRLARGLHDRLPDWLYEPAPDEDGNAVLADPWQEWTLTVEPDGVVDLTRRDQDVGHVRGLTLAELVAMVTCSASRASHPAPGWTPPRSTAGETFTTSP